MNESIIFKQKLLAESGERIQIGDWFHCCTNMTTIKLQDAVAEGRYYNHTNDGPTLRFDQFSDTSRIDFKQSHDQLLADLNIASHVFQRSIDVDGIFSVIKSSNLRLALNGMGMRALYSGSIKWSIKRDKNTVKKILRNHIQLDNIAVVQFALVNLPSGRDGALYLILPLPETPSNLQLIIDAVDRALRFPCSSDPVHREACASVAAGLHTNSNSISNKRSRGGNIVVNNGPQIDCFMYHLRKYLREIFGLEDDLLIFFKAVDLKSAVFAEGLSDNDAIIAANIAERLSVYLIPEHCDLLLYDVCLQLIPQAAVPLVSFWSSTSVERLADLVTQFDQGKRYPQFFSFDMVNYHEYIDNRQVSKVNLYTTFTTCLTMRGFTPIQYRDLGRRLLVNALAHIRGDGKLRKAIYSISQQTKKDYDELRLQLSSAHGKSYGVRAEYRVTHDHFPSMLETLLAFDIGEITRDILVFRSADFCKWIDILQLLFNVTIWNCLDRILELSDLRDGYKKIRRYIATLSIFDSLRSSVMFEGRNISNSYRILWSNDEDSFQMRNMMMLYNRPVFRPEMWDNNSLNIRDGVGINQRITEVLTKLLRRANVGTRYRQELQTALEAINNVETGDLANAIRCIWQCYSDTIGESTGLWPSGTAPQDGLNIAFLRTNEARVVRADDDADRVWEFLNTSRLEQKAWKKAYLYLIAAATEIFREADIKASMQAYAVGHNIEVTHYCSTTSSRFFRTSKTFYAIPRENNLLHVTIRPSPALERQPRYISPTRDAGGHVHSRCPWTAEETSLLIRGYLRHGTRWVSIARDAEFAWLASRRDNIQMRGKYASLRKQGQLSALIQQVISEMTAQNNDNDFGNHEHEPFIVLPSNDDLRLRETPWDNDNFPDGTRNLDHSDGDNELEPFIALPNNEDLRLREAPWDDNDNFPESNDLGFQPLPNDDDDLRLPGTSSGGQETRSAHIYGIAVRFLSETQARRIATHFEQDSVLDWGRLRIALWNTKSRPSNTKWEALRFALLAEGAGG